MSNPHIKGKTIEEKLANLFKEKPATESAQEKQTDKKAEKLIKDVIDEYNKLNKEYNGAIELNENIVNKSSDTFYKPLDIIGFKEFYAYGKQEREFWENLDQTMYDLFKSIEKEGVGIKVLSIKTEITDNQRDRYKTYVLKLQNKGFGKSKPYTVKMHVPIPSKGKYIKMGGNDYIMINQFFPKPVIKISPKTVRVYTQFAPSTIHLKHSSLSDLDSMGDVLENFTIQLKQAKKLKKSITKLNNDEIQTIVDKYNLPENINNDIFVNFEFKD
jgi:hypothetical protein